MYNNMFFLIIDHIVNIVCTFKCHRYFKINITKMIIKSNILFITLVCCIVL